MSKKMLKRSLALGALMAFVITGQAWAESLDDIKNSVNSDILVLDKIYDALAKENVNLENTTGNTTSNNLVKNSTIYIADGQTLTLYTKDVGFDDGSMVLNSTIEGDGKVGNIKIHQAGTNNALSYDSGDAPNTTLLVANTIEVIADNASAIYADGTNDDYTLTANIVTLKGSAMDIPAYSGHTIFSNSGARVTINGFNELNITQGKEGSPYVSDGAHAISNGSGTVNIIGNADSTIYIYSNSRGAITNQYSSATTVIKGGTITIESDIDNTNSDISSSLRKSSVVHAGNGSFTINADKLIVKDKKNTGTAIATENSSDLILKSYEGNDDINIIQITGNIKAESGSLTGFVVDGSESFVKGTINTGTNENADITFSGAGRWENTGASKVNELILDGGIVDNTASNENKIAVGTLSGEGTLKVADATADQMVIGTKAEGAQLTVSTSDQDIALEDMVKVASMEDKNDGQAADFVEKTGGSVYSSEKYAVNADGTLGENFNVIASANVSVNDMVAIGMMSWRAEMNDMNKRMGELRNANGEHGVWVRMVRGESEYNSVKNQYNQYQLGYDEKLSVDKRWTVGAALSYTDAKNNFAEGTGESTNKALSIYGSKLNDDGTFIDLIAKYARLDNDFKTLQGQGAAEYDTNAYSFSAEVGKRIQQGKGLWIEPQVELTYGKVSAVDYVTDKGVNVAQDGMESLVGRIGFSLGKDIEKGNVYARASYLYDFDGETKAVLDGDAVLTNDLGGGWWEVGVGANINLSKATYIYADVEKTFGGEVDTNWQWNLGVRYSF